MAEGPRTATTRLGANYRKLFTAATISNLGDGIGTVAYPWLASAVTRNPFLISLVLVVQRLPWLVFSLPAGVITDRYDRSRIMVVSNLLRAGLTLAVAFIVLARQADLPGPDEVAALAETTGAAGGGDTDVFLYVVVVLASLLLGIGEVLYDNANQTFLPRIVPDAQLERANGRLWSAEQVANAFVGPPLGAWLLLGVFALPFFVDAATFALGAVLIALISVPGTVRPVQPATADPARTSWWAELKEGVAWLWNHAFLRRLAIILGLLNMVGTLAFATLVLFAQEVLDTSPAEFALMTMGSAVGAVVGGWASPWISKRIGSGPSLWLTLGGGAVTNVIIGLTTSWILVSLMFGLFMLLAVLWNVITVSLRQTIIPDEILGRVNSVYRFFAWGMMPLGALAGGLIVAAVDAFASRPTALRSVWFVAAAAHLVILVYGGRHLTTAKIEAARTAES